MNLDALIMKIITGSAPCAVGLDFCNHTLLNCAGEYEAVVIVSVFTNEVDTTG